MDFKTYVGSYELRRLDEFPEKERKFIHDPPCIRHLVRTGPAKLVRPKRQAFDLAVGLLLKTRMPKWIGAELQIFREWSGKPVDARKYDQRQEELGFDADEFVRLERNALLIAKNIGLLSRDLGAEHYLFAEVKAEQYPAHESLRRWIDLSFVIQGMFGTAKSNTTFKSEVEVGRLGIFIAHDKPKTTSLHIRPSDTASALTYHAAQMLAKGVRSQKCVNCGTPFLIGGARDRKRGDSRFCSDECRWKHHNEARRKAKLKSA